MVIIRKVFQTTFQVACASRSVLKCSASQQLRCFSLSSARAAERRYSDKHEWVTVNGAVGVVGISDYAQKALGDVVYAQLPDVGTKLSVGEECGALESVKAASEVYSPVSGTVTEKNAEVEDSPSLINTDCYDKGWLFKISLDDKADLNKLMSESEYEEFLKRDSDH